MENSPLRFLKDNDIITIINEEVPKSRKKMDIKYHMNRYNNKEYNLSKKYFKFLGKRTKKNSFKERKSMKFKY